MENIKIFSGRANTQLAEEIVSYLRIPLSGIEIGDFSDGETYVRIKENVRGADVYVIQPTSPPTNLNLMELLIIIDALKRSSARRITAVISYFGYARQDRKVEPRVPITSKLAANLITTAGCSRILTMDLHAGQIQGFFDIPVDHLFSSPIIIDYFRKKGSNMIIVSPDTGGVERARAVAKRLNAGLGIIDKRRPEKNRSEILNVIGDVYNKNVIIFDDLIDTGGTVVNAARVLKEEGALTVHVACTHPVLSGNAQERIDASEIEEVVVCNTISIKEIKTKKIKVLSVANLFGEAIKRTNEETSISSLFD
ncbi:TPA: phosphoribosylpyrophosphate synthetase [bacterium]|nr:phosphoribosylpyrophosphate synthetase [bacterium]